MKRKIYLLLLIILLTSKTVHSQRANGLYGTYPYLSSFVFSFGPALISSDIGDVQYNMKDPMYNLSLAYQRLYYSNWGLGLKLSHEHYSGHDPDNSVRGFSFSSYIYGLGFQVKRIILGGPFAAIRTNHTLYGFAGVDAFLVTGNFPTARNSSDNVIVGLGFDGLASLGGGYQYRINNRWDVGLEFDAGISFLDHLDGFTRAGSAVNDMLTGVNITLTYKFKGRKINQGRCNCE